MRAKPFISLLLLPLSILPITAGIHPPRAQTSPAPIPAKPDTLQPATPPNAELMRKLETTAKAMGLKVTHTADNVLDIVSKGTTYEFISSTNGQAMFLNVWWDVEKNQVTKIPYEKLMAWNANHQTYFGLIKLDNGNAQVTMSTLFKTENMDAAVVRDRLDILDLDSNDKEVEAMMDTSKWK